MKTLLAIIVVAIAYLLASDEAHAKVSFEAEKTCIATAIYHEARGEPLEGMIAVANVIVNRMESRRFPSTACKVVYQRKQFSWTLFPSKLEPVEDFRNTDILKIAELALLGKLIDYTNGATHYHANYVKPYWKHTKTHTVTIGNHIFYRW
jgi:spore germination cell wall hydrolase CwlJ-like protein